MVRNWATPPLPPSPPCIPLSADVIYVCPPPKHDDDDVVEMEDLINEVDEELRYYDTNGDGYV